MFLSSMTFAGKIKTKTWNVKKASPWSRREWLVERRHNCLQSSLCVWPDHSSRQIQACGTWSPRQCSIETADRLRWRCRRPWRRGTARSGSYQVYNTAVVGDKHHGIRLRYSASHSGTIYQPINQQINQSTRDVKSSPARRRAYDCSHLLTRPSFRT